MSGAWRIEQLMELAAEALALAPPAGMVSGRVRDVPDIRMIRYYTTIGLIDRPAEMRGRTAFYSPRHLRQIVAIKRLQAQGMSLVEIQAALAGATAKKLEQLAGLPDGFVDAALARQLETPAKPRMSPSTAAPMDLNSAPRARSQFWATSPELNEKQETKERDPEAAPRDAHFARQLAVVLPLGSGVSLVLEGVKSEQLSEEVVASLQPAMTMLREALVRAGLSDS